MQTENAAPVRQRSGRRQYLIDRGFQLKYTLIMMVVGAAIALLFGAMMYQAHLEATQLMNLPDPFRTEVASHDGRLLWIVVAIALVMALALGLFGVLITHRVAGPIYVFTHYLHVLGQGRFPQLRPLRRGDELKGFYEAFHGAVAAMREQQRQRGDELKRLADAISEASAKAPEVAAALAPAAQRLGELSRELLDAAASEDPATPGQKAEAARAASAA